MRSLVVHSLPLLAADDEHSPPDEVAIRNELSNDTNNNNNNNDNDDDDDNNNTNESAAAVTVSSSTSTSRNTLRRPRTSLSSREDSINAVLLAKTAAKKETAKIYADARVKVAEENTKAIKYQSDTLTKVLESNQELMKEMLQLLKDKK